MDVQWLCGGDFNEILSPSKRDGGGDRPLLGMLRLKEALEWCDLVDLGYVGSKLTSDNKREGKANIQVRLDRFVSNTPWLQVYRGLRWSLGFLGF